MGKAKVLREVGADGVDEGVGGRDDGREDGTADKGAEIGVGGADDHLEEDAAVGGREGLAEDAVADGNGADGHDDERSKGGGEADGAAVFGGEAALSHVLLDEHEEHGHEEPAGSFGKGEVECVGWRLGEGGEGVGCGGEGVGDGEEEDGDEEERLDDVGGNDGAEAACDGVEDDDGPAGEEEEVALDADGEEELFGGDNLRDEDEEEGKNGAGRGDFAEGGGAVDGLEDLGDGGEVELEHPFADAEGEEEEAEDAAEGIEEDVPPIAVGLVGRSDDGAAADDGGDEGHHEGKEGDGSPGEVVIILGGEGAGGSFAYVKAEALEGKEEGEERDGVHAEWGYCRGEALLAKGWGD